MRADRYSGPSIRLGAWYLISGKAVSAIFSIAILVWVAQLLSVQQFGAYATLLAAAELAYAVSAFGFPWVAARYLPQYHLNAETGVLRRFARRLVHWQVVALLVAATLLASTSGFLFGWFGIELPVYVGLCWAGLVFFEGMGRFLREGLLGPLLMQDLAQGSQILRHASFIAMLAVVATTFTPSIELIVGAEMAAAAMAALVTYGAFEARVRRLGALGSTSNWSEPQKRDLWRTAWPLYAASLLSLAHGPQILVLMLTRFAGLEVSAAFAFLRALSDQVARNLPAMLFFGLLRPKLMASYAQDGEMDELARNANLAGKLSLFVLMPLVIFAAIGGEGLVDALSGGKLQATGFLLLGFMFTLVPFSQRQLLETVAVAGNQAQTCLLASAGALLALPVAFGLIQMGAGAWGGVIALGLAHLLFVVAIVTRLSLTTAYRVDAVGLYKLTWIAALSAGLALVTPKLPEAWPNLTLLAISTLAIFLTVAAVIRPFADDENKRINAHLKRRLFVW